MKPGPVNCAWSALLALALSGLPVRWRRPRRGAALTGPAATRTIDLPNASPRTLPGAASSR